MKPRILLLSGYDAASHQYWRKGLLEIFPEVAWTQLILPPRHFSWRMRGNAFIWATGAEKSKLEARYDLIIATSMVDLTSLFGFFPSLAKTPSILYFHENQFAYPQSSRQTDVVHHQLQSIYSAQVATHLIFNSEYNRSTFLDGAGDLLRKLPDPFPETLVKGWRQKSSLIPVAIFDTNAAASTKDESNEAIPQILWNHRWEYDKQPQVFLRAMDKLLQSGFACRLHVIGQQFRHSPACFDEFHSKWAEYVDSWGYQKSRDQYNAILHRSHIVVSSALHDFQGVAIQEAMQAGCIPVVPNRVAYTEYIPGELRYSVGSEEEEIDQLANLLRTTAESLRFYKTLKSRLSERYLSFYIKQEYATLFDRLLGGED